MTDDGSPRMVEPLRRLLGTRTANALAKLDLHTAGDLLEYFPRKLGDPGTLTDLGSLRIDEHVTVVAQVERATTRQMRARAGYILEAVVSDGIHELSLTFFAKHSGVLRHHESRLVPGRTGLFTGVVGSYRGARQLTHPDYKIFGLDVDDEESAIEEASKPIPIYRATAAVPSWRIQHCVRTVLDPLRPEDLPDPVPAEILARRHLDGRLDALRRMHRPDTVDQWHRGRHRLKYEEAFVLQAALAQRRVRAHAAPATPRPGKGPADGGLLAAFDSRLPFTLTAGQQSVGQEIAEDLRQPHPMQRLLQGDVGAGKTVVALRAMLQVVDSGGQAALLAPTEVLAAQHARTIRAMLGGLAAGGTLDAADNATKVTLLTGSLGAAGRRAAQSEAADGTAGIVIGTHALLSDDVAFHDLGLIVVDEQHRFGVEQRDRLRAKGRTQPHLLVMTATPIPRTVAMTIFGDLETSVLAELPKGRAGISTHMVPARNQTWIDRTWTRVREEVDAGHRVFVVCGRIDPAGDNGETRPGSAYDEVPEFVDKESGKPPRAVLEVADELRGIPVLDGVQIGILHGRMPSADKERAMADFASGATPVLVATTVIEVGVDVPEATTMVVLDADRFGIAQLHQLRGRVGRGSAPGLCLLVSDADEGTPAAERLEALARTTDGFELAAVDLRLRNEGDVLGSAQSGRASSLRLLHVIDDAKLLEEARHDATEIVEHDPDLTQWPALAAAMGDRLDDEREQYLDMA